MDGRLCVRRPLDACGGDAVTETRPPGMFDPSDCAFCCIAVRPLPNGADPGCPIHGNTNRPTTPELPAVADRTNDVLAARWSTEPNTDLDDTRIIAHTTGWQVAVVDLTYNERIAQHIVDVHNRMIDSVGHANPRKPEEHS